MNLERINKSNRFIASLLFVSAILIIVSLALRSQSGGVTPRNDAIQLIDVTPLLATVDAPSGALVQHEVEIRNVRPVPVIVRLGKTDCSCTKVSLNNEPLQPNAVTTARFTISTLDHQHDFSVTTQLIATSLGASALGSSPTEESVLVAVHIVVDDRLGVSPSVIDFGELSRESGPVKLPFVVRYPHRKGTWEHDVALESSAPWLSIDVTPRSNLDGTTLVYHGTVLVRPQEIEHPSGTFLAEATVKTEGTNKDLIYQFRVVGKLISSIEVLPSVLYWTRKDLATPVSVVLRRRAGGQLIVKEASCDRDGVISYTVGKASDESAVVTVTCIYDGESSAELVRARLRIVVADGADGSDVVVTVPVIVL